LVGQPTVVHPGTWTNVVGAIERLNGQQYLLARQLEVLWARDERQKFKRTSSSIAPIRQWAPQLEN
jgi:hypothetical protein